jgi:hypothetical protein
MGVRVFSLELLNIVQEARRVIMSIRAMVLEIKKVLLVFHNICGKHVKKL